MRHLPSEIADHLPLPLRASQVKAHVLLRQPEDAPFHDVCLLLHADTLQLLVRQHADDEYDAFALKLGEPLALGGASEELRLVFKTQEGDRHPVVATPEEVEAVRAVIAQLPADVG
ncbi:MAG: hypothetical protein KAI47_23855, partial [Deltaproteobacteria bacterium]|nr:hypothetical protein [Deltaproteobacteria bacterium]